MALSQKARKDLQDLKAYFILVLVMSSAAIFGFSIISLYSKSDQFRNAEADISEYQEIAWIGQIPQYHGIVAQALKDHKLTNGEYLDIKAKANAEISAETKDTIIEKYQKQN